MPVELERMWVVVVVHMVVIASVVIVARARRLPVSFASVEMIVSIHVIQIVFIPLVVFVSTTQQARPRAQRLWYLSHP